nr:unnamed protein product [Callosobruchus analis]
MFKIFQNIYKIEETCFCTLRIKTSQV